MECEFTAEADSKEELMTLIAEHASTVHGMEEIDDEMMEKIQGVIIE